MIRIMFVDDHPALRAGLETVIRSEPGLVPVGGAASEGELWSSLYRTRPDVLLLDYHLPGKDGLTLCHRLKATTVPSPRVIVFSAYAGPDLALAAVVAGADAVFPKSGSAHDLFETIRTVAGGTKVRPDFSQDDFAAAAERLDLTDRAILAMRVEDTPLHEIGRALRLEPGNLLGRVDRIIGRLRVAVPGSAA